MKFQAQFQGMLSVIAKVHRQIVSDHFAQLPHRRDARAVRQHLVWPGPDVAQVDRTLAGGALPVNFDNDVCRRLNQFLDLARA